MKSHLSRKVEDYLEAIYVIAQDKGHARVRDICKLLGVKPPTVVEMVRKLAGQGYLVYKKNEGVYLTKEGEEIGRIVLDRHKTIFAFLKFIGVPEATANEDACVIEHDLNAKTVDQIKSLVRFIESSSDHRKWLDHFAAFCNLAADPCGMDKKLDRPSEETVGREI